MKMRTVWIALALSALVTAGCEPKDREAIARDSGKALEHAGKAAMTAWNSVVAKVREISPESSKDAIERARLSVVELQKQAEAIPNPGPDVLAQIEQARAAIAKIDAAEQLRTLQERAATLKSDIEAKAKAAREGADELSQQVQVGNEKLEQLQKQIDTARAKYEETAKALENLPKP